MDRPKLEVTNISRRYGEAYRRQHGASLSTAQRRLRLLLVAPRRQAKNALLYRTREQHHAHPTTSRRRASDKALALRVQISGESSRPSAPGVISVSRGFLEGS